jgi:cytochrome P450
MRIQDFDDPSYDPFAAERKNLGDIADIHTPLAKLRRQAPIHRGSIMDLLGVTNAPRSDIEEYTVLSYDLVHAIYANSADWSNAAWSDNLEAVFGRTITTMDAPEHTRYRRIYQQAYLPQNVAKWGDKIVGEVAGELLAKLEGRNKADLITEFTQTYPFEVIYRQLDMPKDDWRIFHRLAVAMNQMFPLPQPEALEAARKLGEYFTALIAARRAEPRDDLITVLVSATVEGESLPEGNVLGFLRQLIAAGGDTTFRATSVFLTALLQNPDQLEALRVDRSLLPQAIEEALRWEPPAAATVRQATRDLTLGGFPIKAGSRVHVAIISANRDERVFDESERFNIFRAKKRNFGFGHGIHICLGQHLARLEITRAMTVILDNLTNLRLDPSKPGPVIRGSTLRYPDHLDVCFDPVELRRGLACASP